MPDKYSASAGLMSAKDYKSQEHLVSDFTVTQALSIPFEITATIVSSTFDTPRPTRSTLNCQSI